MPQAHAPPAPPWRGLLLLALLALAARLLAFAAIGPERFEARGYLYYDEMATHLIEDGALYRTLPYGQGDRFAIRTPGYPLALAAMRRLPGSLPGKVAVFGSLCGAVSVVLAGLLGARAFGQRAGLVAGALLALWPAAVVHDPAMQDTACYTVLLLALVVATWRLRDGATARLAPVLALAVGAVAAAGVLVRVTLILPALALIAWCAWSAAAPRARRLALAAIMLAALGAGLGPWLARNARVVGAPVLTTDTGRSLWLGNNPETFSVYPERSIDRSEERAWAALSPEDRAHVRSLAADERAQDAWFRARAIRFMIEHPIATVKGFARKAIATFSPWMSPAGSPLKQATHALAWAPVLLLAIASLARERRRLGELAPLWMPIVLLAVHSGVFFGHSAYRAYADALAIALAAGLLSRALDRVPRPAVFAAAVTPASILLIAIVARLSALAIGGDLSLPATTWERGYEVGAVARSVGAGEGFADPFGVGTGPTAVVSPLLPAIWGAALSLAAPDESIAWRFVLVLVALASALVAPLLLTAGGRLGAVHAGLFASIAWALHPGAVLSVRSRLPGIFPLLATWAIVEIVLLHRSLVHGDGDGAASRRSRWRGAARAGIALGASLWAEPLLAPFAAVWCALLAVRLGARRARPALAALALAALIISPWIARNAWTLGVVSPRSWAGPELLLGATAGPGEPTPIGLHPTRSPDERQRFIAAGEAAYVREAASRAAALVAERPARWLAACAWRTGVFWLGRASWWRPAADQPLLAGSASALRGPLHAALAVAAWLALVVLWRRRHAIAVPLAILFASYPVTYALTHVEARYRLPIEPLMLLAIGLALAGRRPGAGLDGSGSSQHDVRPRKDSPP